MDADRLSPMQQVFDLLVEEIEERLRARDAVASPNRPEPTLSTEKPPASSVPYPDQTDAPEEPVHESEELEDVAKELPVEAVSPASVGPSHAARLMARLALGLLIVVVLAALPAKAGQWTSCTAVDGLAANLVLCVPDRL